MNEHERTHINIGLVSRFKMLSSMYRQTAVDDRDERAQQAELDWEGWRRLDEISKDYVRKYLADGLHDFVPC